MDELHIYRGRLGADVATLVRRTRDALAADSLLCVGTSAALAGSGSHDEQRMQVASVTSRLFGTEVRPEHIIGETLRRATPDMELGDPAFVTALRQRVADPERKPPTQYLEFVNDPLSVWLASTFGVVTEAEGGRLTRAKPRSLEGDEGAANAKAPPSACRW